MGLHLCRSLKIHPSQYKEMHERYAIGLNVLRRSRNTKTVDLKPEWSIHVYQARWEPYIFQRSVIRFE
jgi:hypothetical protein